jgi:hypothetical protein
MNDEAMPKITVHSDRRGAPQGWCGSGEWENWAAHGTGTHHLASGIMHHVHTDVHHDGLLSENTTCKQ